MSTCLFLTPARRLESGGLAIDADEGRQLRVGLLLSVPITGQVYAQPMMDGSNAIVAAEQHRVYGIDHVTGVREWAIQVGANVSAETFNDQHPTV